MYKVAVRPWRPRSLTLEVVPHGACVCDGACHLLLTSACSISATHHLGPAPAGPWLQHHSRVAGRYDCDCQPAAGSPALCTGRRGGGGPEGWHATWSLHSRLTHTHISPTYSTQNSKLFPFISDNQSCMRESSHKHLPIKAVSRLSHLTSIPTSHAIPVRLNVKLCYS